MQSCFHSHEITPLLASATLMFPRRFSHHTYACESKIVSQNYNGSITYWVKLCSNASDRSIESSRNSSVRVCINVNKSYWTNDFLRCVLPLLVPPLVLCFPTLTGTVSSRTYMCKDIVSFPIWSVATHTTQPYNSNKFSLNLKQELFSIL